MRQSIFCTAAVASLLFLACDKSGEVSPGGAGGDVSAEQAAAQEAPPVPISDRIRVTTSMGAFTLELLPDVAPKTVENFKRLVRNGFFEGTIFHRVIPGFMIQGGGHLPGMEKKVAGGYLPNEADVAKEKGLTNKRGTISMAYVPGNPHGANSQFFINVKNNAHLDFKAKTLTDFGHCPFGRVIQGMDVVDRISKVKTKNMNDYTTVPLTPVIVTKVEGVDADGSSV